MAQDGTTAPSPGAPSALRRSLSLRDLIVYGLLFIGPTAPMGTFGVLDARSHGATALVFVIATVAMAFTAWSYARMAAAVPRAGSVFAYAQAGIGRFPGFIAGWMLGLDYVFIPALASVFTGIRRPLAPCDGGMPPSHGVAPAPLTKQSGALPRQREVAADPDYSRSSGEPSDHLHLASALKSVEDSRGQPWPG